MPLLLPTGPFGLAATFGNDTLTLRLAISFPTFSAFIYINVGFTPAARPFNVALFFRPNNWMQQHYGHWMQLDSYWYYGYGPGPTTNYNLMLATLYTWSIAYLTPLLLNRVYTAYPRATPYINPFITLAGEQDGRSMTIPFGRPVIWVCNPGMSPLNDPEVGSYMNDSGSGTVIVDITDKLYG